MSFLVQICALLCHFKYNFVHFCAHFKYILVTRSPLFLPFSSLSHPTLLLVDGYFGTYDAADTRLEHMGHEHVGAGRQRATAFLLYYNWNGRHCGDYHVLY